MTYQECKNQVLKLLNQYTIAGGSVPVSYNNQEDYIRRIPGLINDAMMEISTTVRKIEESMELTAAAAESSTDREFTYVLPENFYQFKSGDNFLLLWGRERRNQAYAYHGRKRIVVPRVLVEKCSPELIYYRYPTLLNEDDDQVDPDTELDNVTEAHRAIPYYVAGTLALHDDPFLSATLMNGYEDKLAKMEPPITVEQAPVQDMYDFYRYTELY